MISRPTTVDLIEDCCRELTEHVLPELTDETLQVRLVMTETVLRNAAVRAAHEIAWMREETAALRAFADDVAAVHPSDALAAARVALSEAPFDSLHLDDVGTVYELAGQAFEAATSAARDAADEHLLERAARLLRQRVDAEKQIMANYSVAGR